MLCYKDMTFCVASCGDGDCHRKLTTEVKEAAKKWWGDEFAPIAVSDYSSWCDSYTPVEEIK